MKSIVKWIVFVPVCLLSSLLMLFVGITGSGTGSFLNLSINSAAEIVIYSVLGLLAFLFVLSFFDKTTSPVHLLKKNIFCGVTSIIAAFLLAAAAALDFTALMSESDFGAMDVATSIFTMLAGVALLFVGLNHFTGTNTPKSISILYLAIPLWCAVHLISTFLDHTASPVAVAETLDLVMFVFLALFSIYAMMIHAVIPGKNAVKSAVFMGFPTVAICFANSIFQLIQTYNTEKSDFLSYIPAISYGVLGLYVLGFTAELSLFSKTTDQQITVDADEEYDYTSEESSEEESLEESYDASEEAETESTAQVIAPPVEETTAAVSQDTAEVSEPKPEHTVMPRTADDNDEEEHVADELYRVAQHSDSKSKTQESEAITPRSEEKMIIEGEATKVSAQKKPADKAPKGATHRESILLEDDFILSIDGGEPLDSPVHPTFNSDEDISSFILEKTTDEDNQLSAKEKYESRLDEIDKLIISIQGGDKKADDTEE